MDRQVQLISVTVRSDTVQIGYNGMISRSSFDMLPWNCSARCSDTVGSDIVD
jgi:hypothetical protein